MSTRGWIGVDLDGTLAHYGGWDDGKIGAPIKLMVERVQKWITDGWEVRVFTARVAVPQAGVHAAIEAWCVEHIGIALPVTCQKDFAMVELWDDRCVQVIPNTGKPFHQREKK